MFGILARKSYASRVARFFWYNIPKREKIYQMEVK
jgi:hypothetical protein